MSTNSNALAMPAVVKTQDELFAEIEGFTKADFNTDKPYIFCLDNHNDDEMLYMRLKNKVMDQAKAVKYPATDAKKQMQLTEQKNRNLMPKTSQVTAPVGGFTGIDKFFGTAPVNYCGYDCTDNGIMGTTPQGIPVLVCGHPIIVSKRSVNILSNVETLDISFFQDGQWKTIRQIPRADVSSTQKIVPVLASRGVNITSESAKNLVQFLSAFDMNNRQIIPRARTTDIIGWMPDGSFVPFDGDIEVDAMSSDMSLSSMSAALHSKGDPAVWINAVKDRRKAPDSVPVRMILAASFASVLVEPLGRLPGWVHMVGKGTTGKTISLRLASTVWGKAEVSDGWMRTMNATKVGMEVLAGFAHNLPLCLNELQTIQNDKDFAERVYSICECTGRLRGSRSGGLQRSYSWRLMAISCGEQQIVTDADREGANSRVVEIFVDKMLFGDPAKGEPQKFCNDVLDKSYGHAGKMFIQGLKTESMADLSQEFVTATTALIAKGKAPKQADTGALLLIADRLAEKYIFKDGVRLTEDDVLQYLKDEVEINDNRKCYELVRSLIVEKNQNFYSTKNDSPRETWGKIAEDTVSGKKVLKVSFIKQVFDREVKDHGYDSKRFVRWCAEQGMIEDGRKDKGGSIKDNDRHLDKPVRVIPGNGLSRCYVFIFDNEEPDTDPDPKTDRSLVPNSEQNQEPVVTDKQSGYQVVQTTLPF